MQSGLQVGSRVYLRNAICGEPGCVMDFDRRGRALVEWPDLPELGRWTAHAPESLVVDAAFRVRQLGLFEQREAA